MSQGQRPGGLADRVAGACVSLMVAAIALSLAISLIRPYLALLAIVGILVTLVVAWRSWQRSRW